MVRDRCQKRAILMHANRGLTNLDFFYKTNLNMNFKIFFCLLLFPFSIWAHTNHDHSAKTNQPPAMSQLETSDTQELAKLAERYRKEVQPIFQAKCMDCHSQNTKFPWYYKWPVAKQLIDQDVKEAKTHLDMTEGYPFVSHATPKEDLEAIVETVRKQEMPPWRYRILHPDSALTEHEQSVILSWASEGATFLSVKGEKGSQ